MNAPIVFAFLNQLGPMELGIVLVLAVLLFGKRLPEVGRSLGKGIIEFKKGLRGIEDELDSASSSTPSSKPADAYRPQELAEPSVPKFEPPASPPVARNESESPTVPA